MSSLLNVSVHYILRQAGFCDRRHLYYHIDHPVGHQINQLDTIDFEDADSNSRILQTLLDKRKKKKVSLATSDCPSQRGCHVRFPCLLTPHVPHESRQNVKWAKNGLKSMKRVQTTSGRSESTSSSVRLKHVTNLWITVRFTDKYYSDILLDISVLDDLTVIPLICIYGHHN